MTVLHHIPARTAHLGVVPIKRVLPSRLCRKVGPWVFLDHFGPDRHTAERSRDVRPHPHIGLSTVSYLFEGSIHHRDSLGSDALVRPGEIHWMRAGHGIVHSERAPEDTLGTTVRSHGLQLWCAHPDGAEDQEPAFGSWRDLPALDVDGVRVELLAGTGWGQESPVAVTSPLVYGMVHLRAGQSVALPDHAERCVYPVSGRVGVDGEAADAFEMLVVDPSARRLEAGTDAVVAVLGGDAIGPRHIWWNLVHSDAGYLAEQAERWRQGGFPTIPGDDAEFIPAPDGP
ncbi:MAG: pirin family protein [Alphaproteobacteria bacterium]|nr:pirin family protein [Alphaproteobacteria bacterium]